MKYVYRVIQTLRLNLVTRKQKKNRKLNLFYGKIIIFRMQEIGLMTSPTILYQKNFVQFSRK